jgi:LysR family transcriptional regulator for metE and metH
VPLQLDLRHYETVVAIVELGTMTEAAKRLSTTQSALSHRLAEAERRLGTKLFDRAPDRRLKPTRAGLTVHQTASRALLDLERSEKLLIAENRGITSVVRIGVDSYDCFHWYPPFLRSVHELFPEVQVDLAAINGTPAEVLASGIADIVVAPGDAEGPVIAHPLAADELVLVVSPEHHLADRTSVEPEDLADEVYMTYNPNPSPGFEYDRFIRPAAMYPAVVTVVQQTNAIVELVAAGAGVSILSRWALTPSITTGRVVAVRCGAEGLSLPWNALVRNAEPDTSPVHAIATHLAAHLTG